jgi:hypothetical protein
MRGLIAVSLFAVLGAAAPVLAGPQSGRSDSYILAIGDSWTSGDVDLDEIVGMRERLSGDFLWFRRSGKSYRVDDAAWLKKAQQCFEGLRALDPELETFRRSERELDAKEEALDREQEEIEQDLEDLDADEEAGMTVDAKQRDVLEERRDAVASKMWDLEAEQRRLESVERELDDREEELEAQAEARLWSLIDESVAAGAARKWPPAR